MLERLTQRGSALADKVARRRRRELAEALGDDAPAGVRVSEEEEGVALSGPGLGRRFALETGLMWLLAGRGR